MTVAEARKLAAAFNENHNPSEAEITRFIGAMEYLIEAEGRPEDMMYLGGYHYEQRRFDLALKYYEMAAALDFDDAYECLGYIWYYGRTGERDYAKAFYYFSKMMEKGSLAATYKVADMYKNGYHVAKNQAKYEEMIEALYPKVLHCKSVFDPIPEVFTRLARIRRDRGEEEAAAALYLDAKDCLAERISINAFFGNLNMMKWLVDDLYELIEFQEDSFDFFDLYYLLKTPHRVAMRFDEHRYVLESALEGEECAVYLNGMRFANRDQFFQKAVIDGKKATSVWDDFYDFEVLRPGAPEELPEGPDF